MYKRNILIITNSLYGGGAEKMLHLLLAHLDYTKYYVTLYSLRKEKLSCTLSHAIRYHYFFDQILKADSFYNKLSVKFCNKIKLLIYKYTSPRFFYRQFVKGKYDIEVAFIEGYATRIVSGSRQSSTKIAWVHIDLLSNHWTQIAFKNDKEEMSCYRKFDTIVSVSKSVGSAIKTLFPDISNPFTIYNGIDSDRIRELSERQSFLQDQSFTFVTCGRLVPQKGFDRLIEASYRLHKEGFLFKVVVIGEGKERKELENSLTKKDLSNTVVLLGYKDNPYPIFKQSSCYICSSRTEGLPLVILEAMTLGIPVVSTDCSGPNEIIGNSEFGLLVSNDTDGIYEGMKLLLSDKGLLNHYHLKSLERYRSFDVHNWMIAVDKLLSN